MNDETTRLINEEPAPMGQSQSNNTTNGNPNKSSKKGVKKGKTAMAAAGGKQMAFQDNSDNCYDRYYLISLSHNQALYQLLVMLIDVAEDFRRLPFLLFEDAVEIGDVIESTIIADLGYRCGGVYQQAARMSETHIYDIVGY